MYVIEYEKDERLWYIRFRTKNSGSFLDYGRFKTKEEAEERLKVLDKYNVPV